MEEGGDHRSCGGGNSIKYLKVTLFYSVSGMNSKVKEKKAPGFLFLL